MAKIKIQVHIDKEIDDHLSRLSEKLGENKPEILRRIINMGLDDALLLEKTGVISVVMKAGDIMNTLKKHFLFDGKTEISIEDLKDI